MIHCYIMATFYLQKIARLKSSELALQFIKFEKV